MAYIVEYFYPGLGRRRSSVWQLESDALSYASTKPESWGAKVLRTRATPDIFRHCGPNDDQVNPSQAVGGHCFTCGRLLTRKDAR